MNEEEEFQNYDLDSQSLFGFDKTIGKKVTETILNMYVFEEMSHKEIADVLQIKDLVPDSIHESETLSKKIIENHISASMKKQSFETWLKNIFSSLTKKR